MATKRWRKNHKLPWPWGWALGPGSRASLGSAPSPPSFKCSASVSISAPCPWQGNLERAHTEFTSARVGERGKSRVVITHISCCCDLHISLKLKKLLSPPQTPNNSSPVCRFLAAPQFSGPWPHGIPGCPTSLCPGSSWGALGPSPSPAQILGVLEAQPVHPNMSQPFSSQSSHEINLKKSFRSLN